MDLVKMSNKFARFLSDDNLSLNDIYTHLISNVFLIQITNSMSPIDILKCVFLVKTILDGNDPTKLNKILDENLFLFSIISFDGSPETDCSNCNGNGNVDCDKCNGDGRVECINCDGDGRVECINCDGTGFENEDDGESINCNRCDGYGTVRCTNCDGGGLEFCDDCSGGGREICNYCDGDGTETVDGANFDINMFVSYNPILKNILENKYKSDSNNSKIDEDNIERNQTFLFNIDSVIDSTDNVHINPTYQYNTFVNNIITNPNEFDLIIKKLRFSGEIIITADSLKEANDKFK